MTGWWNDAGFEPLEGYVWGPRIKSDLQWSAKHMLPRGMMLDPGRALNSSHRGNLCGAGTEMHGALVCSRAPCITSWHIGR